MVLSVRPSVVLTFLLFGVPAPVQAATRTNPPYLRTSLDDAPPAAVSLEPRRIRSSLDDATVVLPLATGRLIRLSLDGDRETYGRLLLERAQSRRIRTTLD
jgi:hypothetical protein